MAKSTYHAVGHTGDWKTRDQIGTVDHLNARRAKKAEIVKVVKEWMKSHPPATGRDPRKGGDVEGWVTLSDKRGYRIGTWKGVDGKWKTITSPNPSYRASCAPKAGELTAKKRKRLPAKAYGLPKERKYPMPDASHARNAKARASTEYGRGNLTRKQYAMIQRKANRIIKSCGGDPAAVKNPGPGYFARRKQAWKTWHTVTDGKKHKMTACMRKFKGEVDDVGAYCGWLRDQAGEEDAAIRKKKKYPDPFKMIKKNPEVTRREWKKALKTDEAMLRKYEGYLKRLQRGEKVQNLTEVNAKKTIRGLKIVIKNKRALLRRKNPKKRPKKRTASVKTTVSRTVTVTQNPAATEAAYNRTIAAWSRI